FLADGHGHNALGPANFVAFFYLVVIAEQHRPDFVLFQIQRDARNLVRQIEQFARHHSFEPIYFGDSVAGLYNGSDLGHLDLGVIAFDLLAYDLAYFICSYRIHSWSPLESGVTLSQSFLDLFELRAHGSVIHNRADACNNAAYQ